MNRNISNQLYETAKKLFPGGVNSPVRAFKSVYGAPLFIEKGEGPYIWDADGNRFLDFCCSWGPLILGHRPEPVMKAINEVLEKGTTFGAPSRYGIELAQLIIDNNPYIEKIRFVSSGTEAVMSAVRLARGATGRNKVVKFEGCYHGHVDHLLVKAGSGLATFGVSSSAGVPDAFAKETLVAPLNDKEALTQLFEEHGEDISSIIIEPIPANNGLLIQDKSYLQFLRDICTKYGALLIFDEVISGFRVGFCGASDYYQIQPDIITFGKIIGGGMPVGAFAASNKIMSFVAPDGPVYQAGTLSANPVAMAAGTAQLKACLEEGFYCDLYHKTADMVEAVNAFCKEKNLPVKFVQTASIFWMSFAAERITKADEIDGTKMFFFKEIHALLLEKGIYLGPSGYEVGFVSAAHTKEVLAEAVKIFCECIETAFQRIEQAEKMDYNGFFEVYEPLKNDIISEDEVASYDGCMFETYGEEVEKVKTISKRKVATITEVDGKQYIVAGFHLVNRLGYFITKHPIPNNLEIEIKFDDNMLVGEEDIQGPDA